MNLSSILSLIIAAIAPTIALAASWAPWCDQLVASPNGKFYVVVKRTDGPKVYGEWGPVEFVICEHAANAQPIKNAKSRVLELGSGFGEYNRDKGDPYEIKPNPKVGVQGGGKILGRGKLARPPGEILVSNTGLGFAGLDVYGYHIHRPDDGLKADNAVIIVASSGKVIHEKRLIDLFTDDEIECFDTSGAGIHWLSHRPAGWINEGVKQLVIISDTSETKPIPHLVRFIDWQTGKSTKGPTLTSRKDIENLRRSILQSRPSQTSNSPAAIR